MLDLVDVQISPFLLLIFREFSTFSRQLKVSTRSDLSSRRLTVKSGYCILTSSALHTRIFEDSLCMFSFCSLPKPLSSPEFAPVAFLRCVSACARVCGHTSGSSCLLLRFHTRLQKCACLHRRRFFFCCVDILASQAPPPPLPPSAGAEKRISVRFGEGKKKNQGTLDNNNARTPPTTQAPVHPCVM